MWNHWVARASTPYEPFRDFKSARWAWTGLTALFPEMIATVLMPNHLHLILPSDVPTPRVHRKLGGFLGAVSVQQQQEKLWQQIPSPSAIPDRAHLRRQIRYLALNPCRKGLCADPLEWYWSTYRDVMGATADGEHRTGVLTELLRMPLRDFRVRFHSYVSGDPSVKVEGTAPPKAAIPKIWAEESIGEILAAAAGALRTTPVDVQKQGPLRPLFIHLAYRHGWRQPTLLAEICGVSPRAIQFLLSQPPPSGIHAADLCLGDRRLRSEKPFARFAGTGRATQMR